jgi:hypothetical protein
MSHRKLSTYTNHIWSLEPFAQSLEQRNTNRSPKLGKKAREINISLSIPAMRLEAKSSESLLVLPSKFQSGLLSNANKRLP